MNFVKADCQYLDPMKDNLAESLQFKLVTEGWQPRDDMADELRRGREAAAGVLIMGALVCIVAVVAAFVFAVCLR